MNSSLGFFVGGQVLAGILGSVVPYRHGPEGKLGANSIQSRAASVSGMCAMALLVQAAEWLGMPLPEICRLPGHETRSIDRAPARNEPGEAGPPPGRRRW